MVSNFRKWRLVSPMLALALLLGLAATACASETPAAPSAPSPVVQTEATPTLTPHTPIASAPDEPPPAAAVATSTPTPVFQPLPATSPSIATATAATPEAGPQGPSVFDDLDALEKLAFSYLTELAVDVGVRTSGTDLEEQASQYLEERFRELGYSPELQEFSWGRHTAKVEIAGESLFTPQANVFSEPVTGQGAGVLVPVGLAGPEDMPEDGLEGKVALIERGQITFSEKVSRVAQAGAVAAIIFNNQPGNFRGRIGADTPIPSVSLSQADGQHLKERIDRGETIEATVSIARRAVASKNLIVELPGHGNDVVVLGAHYDTVPESIGASDNASGLGVLMAVAESLADRSLPYTLRFIAFGSEETGLHGSRHYVESLAEEDLEAITLMINLDSVGSGSRLYASGDRWAYAQVEEAANRRGISLGTSRTVERNSDHASFRDAWVPIVYFWANDLSRINSPADTMEHINQDLLGEATVLVLDLLENVAQLPGYGH